MPNESRSLEDVLAAPSALWPWPPAPSVCGRHSTLGPGGLEGDKYVPTAPAVLVLTKDAGVPEGGARRTWLPRSRPQ